MGDRARKSLVRRRARAARPVKMSDVANDDTALASLSATVSTHTSQISSLQSADTALDARLDVLELPLRVKGRRNSNQNIATATSTFVDFNAADDYDLTNWHDHTSGTLSVRESFTVPATGAYVVVATAKWAAAVLTTVFRIEVTVDGTALPETVEEAGVLTGDVYVGQLVAFASLTAGQVLKMRVRQQSTVALDLASAVLAITRAYP